MGESSEQALELADVYAAALFELAEKAGQVTEVRTELEELVRLAAQEPAFGSFMASGVVNAERRQASLERMFRGRLSDLVLNTLLVLNQHGRAGLLPALLRSYVLREEHSQGQLEVVATSAVELDQIQRQEIERWITETVKKKPLVEYLVDPEIIGGLIIRMGDYRFDDSVRRHLHLAHAKLLERSSHGLNIGTTGGESAVS